MNLLLKETGIIKNTQWVSEIEMDRKDIFIKNENKSQGRNLMSSLQKQVS